MQSRGLRWLSCGRQGEMHLLLLISLGLTTGFVVGSETVPAVLEIDISSISMDASAILQLSLRQGGLYRLRNGDIPMRNGDSPMLGDKLHQTNLRQGGLYRF
jgi:hypothetical protein